MNLKIEYENFVGGLDERIIQFVKHVVNNGYESAVLSYCSEYFPHIFPPFSSPSLQRTKLARRMLENVNAQQVKFYLAAASRDELGPSSIGKSHYGNLDRFQWYPFGDSAKTPISIVVQRIAVDERMISSINEVTDSFLDEVRAAESMGIIVVVLVDIFSLRLIHLASNLQKFDAYDLFNSGVVVVWNLQDPDVQNNMEALRETLETIFERKFAKLDRQTFCHNVTTASDFAEHLGVVLSCLRNRVIAVATRRATRARIEGEGPLELPLLRGPGGHP